MIFFLTTKRRCVQSAHSSQLTAHSSQLTAHSSQLTAHSSQLTAHSSQLTKLDSNQNNILFYNTIYFNVKSGLRTFPPTALFLCFGDSSTGTAIGKDKSQSLSRNETICSFLRRLVSVSN